MKPLQDKTGQAFTQKPNRRSFLGRLIVGTLGAWTFLNIKPSFGKQAAKRKAREASIPVRIHAEAVPRTNTSVKSNGK